MTSKKEPIDYTQGYQPEYCQMLIDHMAKGFSFSTFGKIVNKSKTTLDIWVSRHPDFEDAKNKAEQHAKYLFESKLLEKQEDYESKVDATIGKFMLNARFRDEYSENKNSNVKVERLEDLINSLSTPEESE